MRKLLHLYRLLPAGAHYVIVFLAIALPLTIFRSQMPGPVYFTMLGSVGGFLLFLYGVRSFLLMKERVVGRKLDREIGDQSVGPSRRELADAHREYRDKWLLGLAKLKKANLSLYHLPWYIILGEPGGGKTMTLLNSGMDFPMGKDELPGFGGTRNYNWWFTNTAVFLDTAGRLVFEQEGTTDRHEWEAFLRLLKKRRRCPINGVVVALPADKLTADPPEKRYENACIIRDRLRQIQSVLEIRFPVFVLVTKSDLIGGFTEFFNDQDSLRRNQLFGWSREGDFQAPYDTREFDEDFTGLYHRLQAHRLKFLSRPSSETETGWIYTFPEAFATLKDRIRDYMDVIFSPNVFSEPLFFRGFFFTSALQEGRPILDILGRHFTDEQVEHLEGIFPQSRAFFIHDFYTDKVAKEQGMVYRSAKHIRRLRWFRNSIYYLGAPLLIAFIALAYWGYRGYREVSSEPLQVAQESVSLIQQYKDLQERDQVWNVGTASKPMGGLQEAMVLYNRLEEAASSLEHAEGIAALMFPSAGGEARRHIKSIQRSLVGYCVLRPAIQLAEQLLTQRASWTPENAEMMAEGLRAYMQAASGDPSADFDALLHMIASSGTMDERAIELLRDWASTQETGSSLRWAGGLTSDPQHPRSVVSAALEEAQTYWSSIAEIDRHQSYAWWVEFIRLGTQVKEQYQLLLDMAPELSRARTQDSIEAVAKKFLSLFPQPTSSIPEDVSITELNVQLLLPLRTHLKLAPRDESGKLITLNRLIDQNLEASNRFWESVAASMLDYAPQQSDRVERTLQDAREKIQIARNTFHIQIERLDDILAIDSKTSPNQIGFTTSAKQAERLLAEQCARKLRRFNQDSQSASLDGWNVSLRELLQQAPPESLPILDPSWQPQRLQALLEAAYNGQRRYQVVALIQQMRHHLSTPPEAGLAALVEGNDDIDRAGTLRFESLRNRHAGSFLIATTRSKLALEDSLRTAVKENLIPDASELSHLLDDAMHQYVQHYLENWSIAYTKHELDRFRLFKDQPPRDWDAYREWMHEHATSLFDQYEERLESIFIHAVEPFLETSAASAMGADARAELASYLDRVLWPLDDRLGEVLDGYLRKGVGADAAESSWNRWLAVLQKEWQQFEYALRRFQMASTSDLDADVLLFPDLNALTRSLSDQQTEWLTRQLQYVVDYGLWLLVRDVLSTIRVEDLQPYEDAVPFVFAGGTHQVDPLELKALLETLSQVALYLEKQHLTRSLEEATAWLSQAKQWHQFLDMSVLYLEIQLDPTGASGYGQFYEYVALRLPGLRTPEGTIDREFLFPLGQEAPARSFHWARDTGRVEITLHSPTQQAKARGVEMKPRILSISESPFGLIALLQQYAEPLESDRRQWHIRLSGSLHEIQGLKSTQSEESQQHLLIIIHLQNLEQGLPSPMEWPDWTSIDRARPALPGANEE